jgi:hypothetical protein
MLALLAHRQSLMSVYAISAGLFAWPLSGLAERFLIDRLRVFHELYPSNRPRSDRPMRLSRSLRFIAISREGLRLQPGNKNRATPQNSCPFSGIYVTLP